MIIALIAYIKLTEIGNRHCRTDFLSTGPYAGECYSGDCKGSLRSNLEDPCLEVYTYNDAYYDTATVPRVDVNILDVEYSAYGNWDIDSTTNAMHHACRKLLYCTMLILSMSSVILLYLNNNNAYVIFCVLSLGAALYILSVSRMCW